METTVTKGFSMQCVNVLVLDIDFYYQRGRAQNKNCSVVTLVHISVQEFWPLPAAAHIPSGGLNLIMRPANPLKHTLKCCFFCLCAV